MVVHPDTDNPERFARGAVVTAEGRGDLTVVRSAPSPHGVLVLFEGVSDRTAAEELRGTSLSIAANDRRPLDEDEYWPDQVEGCSVVTDSGRDVGRVVDVVEGAAQNRLVVEMSGSRYEVPFVADLVSDVDLAASRITVVDMPGLIPDPT